VVQERTDQAWYETQNTSPPAWVVTEVHEPYCGLWERALPSMLLPRG